MEMGSLDCEVCLEDFDEGKHLPRCLTCGHTLCTSCIHTILHRKTSLKCPFCRVQHKTSVSSPAELPVNYSMMKVLRGQQDISDRVISTEKPEDWFKCIKEDISNSADTLFCDLEDDLNKLRRLHKRLESKEHSHVQLLSRMSEFISYLKKVGGDISSEKLATKEALEKGDIQWDNLKASRECLKTSKTLVEVSDAHQSIVKCHTDIDEWRGRTQHFHCSDVLKKYKALKRVTNEALSLVPVKQEESYVREWMDGLTFLLFTVAFVCCIMSACWKAM